MLPGYQAVEDPEARQKFADRWSAEPPEEAGPTAVEMITQVKEGKVKGMYIVGENPVLSFPNSTLVTEALASLEFLVVQDMFLTETAKLAHVVLPAASFTEKEGTFTNFEGRVQWINRVIAPLGDSLPDSEITLRLADSMGCPMPFSSLEEVMDEIRELVPLYQGIGYGGTEMREQHTDKLGRDPFRNRRLYKGQFPSGFGRFSPVQYEPQAEITKDGYNFTLLTGSVLYHSGTGSKTSRSARLSEFSPAAYVEIHEADAEQAGIGQGDEVRVISPVGEVAAVARLTDGVPRGVVFMPNSIPSTPVNQLFDIELDPQAKTPALKACAVKLERT
jgi:predicted molibdopterin-dependent oxidoreductase YjgC